jgi:hypothetical protein
MQPLDHRTALAREGQRDGRPVELEQVAGDGQPAAAGDQGKEVAQQVGQARAGVGRDVDERQEARAARAVGQRPPGAARPAARVGRRADDVDLEVRRRLAHVVAHEGADAAARLALEVGGEQDEHAHGHKVEG